MMSKVLETLEKWFDPSKVLIRVMFNTKVYRFRISYAVAISIGAILVSAIGFSLLFGIRLLS